MDHLNSTGLPTPNQTDFSNFFTLHVLPPLYLVICIVGLCLNGLAAWIFFRVPSDSGLVVYLKNMVVADLLMLVTFPFRLAAQLGLGGWRVHVIMCRYTAVLFYSSMYVGILFMGLISLERYFKIVRHTSPSPSSSCRSRWGGVSLLHLLQNVSFARVLALLIWSLLLLLCVLPNALLTSHPANEENSRHCMQLKTPLGMQWHRVSTFFSVSLFWVTLLVLAFCYASIACRIYQSYRRVRRNNSNACRKSNRSIFSILAVFFICFVPYHVCRVPYTLSQMPASGFSQETRFVLFQVKEGTLFLSALNVCLDPIIYFLMCRTFRESLLKKLSGREGRRSLTTAQSLTNI
ncbi:P2Y purinoceptor 14 [Micropterus dolomieu]|uniref:P2Y purinoceptor 14 n=1 Tax=Micropterus dolomieu TaxID=147949 RepID=UPI001E8E3BE7|nr:P2Y purinoceptor 14 [Micropterus dolomieu]XP_045930451.1 P2Y purinoceptor 14 [Micropterus dolomieu]XP_045930452.1 P2Y purinoceptor 14 [Micropterus dolomieu]